jgi:cell division protein FtsB
MISHDLLWIQVNRERKMRHRVVLTVLLLSIVYLVATFTFGDSGLIRYFELRAKKDRLEREIKESEEQNAHLRTEIKRLKENPFYREKYAREDYGLARSGEIIFEDGK